MNHLEVPLFSLKHTLDAGHTFSWNYWEAGGATYATTVDDGVAVKVWQDTLELHLLNYESSKPFDAPGFFSRRFRLHDDLEAVYGEISRDEVLAQAVQKYKGLRMVKDPFWECVVSFISSAQNQIPRIRESMNLIRQNYGEAIDWNDRVYYSFPPPEVVAQVSVSDFFEKTKTAFRAKHIIKAAQQIVSGEIPPQRELEAMPFEQARREVSRLFGVGEKVADCVCLYSLGKMESFPIDTWIAAALRDHYPGFPNYEKKGEKAYREASAAAINHFGRNAGYAQQYLYIFKRKNSRQGPVLE
ncbi:MAG TPA: DNA glycosylase [archaeon]|nr:DNA glycosylase [archaeon]